MSVDQLPNRRGSAPGDAKLVRYDRYIDAKIQSTRRLVKVVDLVTAFVLLTIGALAFLLAAAVVEHWLVPGGFSRSVRLLLFAVLVGGTGYFAYRRLWPLLMRAINPVYAAHTIEQNSPTLKNTLINLLQFRQRRGDLSTAVYQTLEEQAAQRLTRVPSDSAVDRTHLIRLGYVLVAVVACVGAYTIFSPRDPLITAERVLWPWADIAPASRVRVSTVEPGDVTVSRGEFLNISAEIRGLRDDDRVMLRFTTADGQAIDKAIPMDSNRSGTHFECRLPAPGDGGPQLLGLAQSLTYRIEAGDARSRDYAATVVPAPAIFVRRIEYDFPEYTGEADRAVDIGAGRVGPDPEHIRAIEGTRVTIQANANGPIDKAFIDFNADGRRDLAMTAEGAEAQASFVLALRDDRRTPKHVSYVLRFQQADGRENVNPVKHPIEVLRDFDPEVALVAPSEKVRDVRLDETVTIEVDAHDPDFALSEVRLRGAAVGRPDFDATLLAQRHLGRFTGRYAFTPKEHQLRAGDIVQYWVTARDNRTPIANSAESERHSFRIVSPDPATQPPPDRIARNERPRKGQGNESQPDQADGPKQLGNDGGAPQPGQQDGQPKPGQSGGDSADNANQQRQNGDAQRNAEQQRPGGTERQPGDSQPRPGQSDQNSEQVGANQPGGDASQQVARPDGARPEQGDPKTPAGNRGGQSGGENREQSAGGNDGPPSDNAGARRGGANNAQQNDSGEPGDADSEPSPISSDGDNDAEAFRRIREHLRQNKQLDGDDSDSGSSDGKSPSDVPESPEKQTGSPAGRPTISDDPTDRGDPSGQNQRIRNAPPGAKPDARWEQTPGQLPDQPNTGGAGRSKPNSAGDEGGQLPNDSQDAVDKPIERDGAGNTGQSQSAERGAGESGERGAGNDSSDAGRDVTSAQPTGQPGDGTPGRGTTRREGEGRRAGGSAGDSQQDGSAAARRGSPGSADGNNEPMGVDAQRSADGRRGRNDSGEAGAGERGAGERGAGNRGAGDSTAESDQQAAGSADGVPGERGAPARGNEQAPADRNRVGAPTGSGGQNGTRGSTPPRAVGTAPEGDVANLEYARKQTDLVLEKLSEQLNRTGADDDLLKKLGWTKEDLQRFVDRWRQRKEAAQRSEPAADAARRDLDDALRSLGLRAGQLRQSQVRDDELRDLSQGYRGPVPLELQERLRAYNQGVSQAREK